MHFLTNGHFFKLLVTCLCYFLLSQTTAYATGIPPEKWLQNNNRLAIYKILSHTSRDDGRLGAMIAAPSRENPNYYYHWVRDAGIVALTLSDHETLLNDRSIEKKIRGRLLEYRDFSTYIQNVPTLSDLGEPKFHVTGEADSSPWGRPQLDGPALRAISLIHLANRLLEEREEKVVRDTLYDGKLPTKSPIKKDLEYISYHWQDQGYDIWEEVKGLHFYTLMVQRRALLEGAKLADRLQDPKAAKWYREQAERMEPILESFYNPTLGFIIPTMDRTGGIDYKHSNIDTSVILGLLHGDMQDGFLAWNDVRVIKTIYSIYQGFSKLYTINMNNSIPGIAIGRYPEDRYAGTNFNGGNPWPLCTLAMAEAMYRYAIALNQDGRKDVAKRMVSTGDQLVARVQHHAHASGELNEQIHRETGFMTSVPNLTWNYAAMLTTHTARKAATA